MALASLAEFARLYGVSKQAVAKWKTKELLVVSDGKIDVEKSILSLADRDIHAVDAPSTARQPVDAPRQPSTGGEPASTGAELASSDPQDAADAVGNPGQAAALVEFLNNLQKGQFTTFASAQTIKENALAGIRALEFLIKSEALIELPVAEAIFFTTARSERDAWRGWPSRIAPKLASELGIAEEALTAALERYVLDELASRGEPQFGVEDDSDEDEGA